MEDCIFCKIKDNKLPHHRVYEDENVIAFLDVLPVNKGHTLIVPKTHTQDLDQIPQSDLCSMIIAARKIGHALTEGLNAHGYSILINNKDGANQHVDHAHIHLVPRWKDDKLESWPKSGYASGEAEEVVKKIRAKIKEKKENKGCENNKCK